MSNSSSSSSGGIGLFGAIFIVFLTLKLAGVDPVASWSWWWVTAPLWVGFVVVFVVLFIVIAVAAMKNARDWRSR